MRKNIILVIIAMLFCPVLMAEEECEVGKDIGRYQISTSYRMAGDWGFVTIIDTSTGKIVTQERYNGFTKYEKK